MSEPTDRFQAVLDAMQDLVTIESAVRNEAGEIVDFRIEYMNPVNIDVAGRSRDDLIGGLVSELYPAMAGTEVWESYRQVVETGDPVFVADLPYEDVIDGEAVVGSYAMHLSKFGDGVLISARDMSEERRTEGLLTQMIARLDAAQRLARMGIWEIDVRTREVTFTDELYRIFGLEPGDPANDLGATIESFISPADRAPIEAAVRAGKPFTQDVTVRRVDGVERVLRIFGAEPEDDRHLWGTAQDVTDVRATEQALYLADAALATERASVELLQNAVLPTLPEVPGVEVGAVYVPAGSHAKIGGDWYDVLALPDDHLLLAVGDVAGHGVEAAAAMAQVRNALRGCAFAGLGSAEMSAVVSDLYRATHPDSFVTGLVAIVTPATGALRWTNAGHPPPVVLTDDGEVQFLTDRSGPPLGIGRTYQEAATTLPTGSTLVVYTDGLIEHPGESIDCGLDRLRDAAGHHVGLPPGDLCRALVDELTGEVNRDDLCVLAVRAARLSS